jgi:ankyrin repeat protein
MSDSNHKSPLEKLLAAISTGDVSGLESVLCDSSPHELSSADMKGACVLHKVLAWCVMESYKRLNEPTHDVHCHHVDCDSKTESDISPEVVAATMMKILLADSRYNVIADRTCLEAVQRDKAGRGEFHSPLLMTAASAGLASIVELLLAHPCMDKALIDQEQAGLTPLMSAASADHIDVVKLLLADSRVDKASIDHVDRRDFTALMHAATADHASIVKLLLADSRVDKTSIDHADAYGMTALTHASFNGCNSVVELLLADSRVDKTSIDHTDHYHHTPLMYAAMNGHVDTVERLLAHPCVDASTIDCAGQYGETALVLAMKYDHASIATSLIENHKSSFSSISDSLFMAVVHSPDIVPNIIAELTRREMRTIYPSSYQRLHPVPADDEADCALLTSFINSPLFDVNVLRIIREYVKLDVVNFNSE